MENFSIPFMTFTFPVSKLSWLQRLRIFLILKMRNSTHFHRFWWFLMKFYELKLKFLNNYMELEHFKNCALLLNLFVIDLEHQIHVMCSGTKNIFLTVTVFKFENYDRWIFFKIFEFFLKIFCFSCRHWWCQSVMF